VTRFNWKALFGAALAGVLIGILTARPALWSVVGVVAGGGLAFAIRPKKKSCCQ
jgi:hypothetical protein